MEGLEAYRARQAAMYKERLIQEERNLQMMKEAEEARERAILAEKAAELAALTSAIDGIRNVLAQISDLPGVQEINECIKGYNDETPTLPDHDDIKASAMDILQSINTRALSVDMHNDAHLITDLKTTVGCLLHKAGVLATADEEIDLQIDMDCSRDLWMAIQLDNELNGLDIGPILQPAPRRPRARRAAPRRNVLEDNEPADVNVPAGNPENAENVTDAPVVKAKKPRKPRAKKTTVVPIVPPEDAVDVA